MPIEVHTPDNLQYQFYPAAGGCFSFKVRTGNDAHVALTPAPMEDNLMTEIFIGGWGNTKSVIRKNRQKPDVVEVETPQILNAGEYRGFWIRWYQGVITVGREGEAAAFMSFEDHNLHPINYVGVCTGWGAQGSWIIEDLKRFNVGYIPEKNAFGWISARPGIHHGCWIYARGGNIPPGAIDGGYDGFERLYLARALHKGSLIPGKLHPSHKGCYVSSEGSEHHCKEYEILCCASGSWISVSGNHIPPNAIQGGQSDSGEVLYIGRANHNGTMTPGKVMPSRGRVYIPYGGQEIPYFDYEIFVMN